jgi:hypothetical protein
VKLNPGKSRVFNLPIMLRIRINSTPHGSYQGRLSMRATTRDQNPQFSESCG